MVSGIICIVPRRHRKRHLAQACYGHVHHWSTLEHPCSRHFLSGDQPLPTGINRKAPVPPSSGHLSSRVTLHSIRPVCKLLQVCPSFQLLLSPSQGRTRTSIALLCHPGTTENLELVPEAPVSGNSTLQFPSAFLSPPRQSRYNSFVLRSTGFKGAFSIPPTLEFGLRWDAEHLRDPQLLLPLLLDSFSSLFQV